LAERGSPLTGCLDPAALVTPLAAEEAVRRTVARSLGAMCGSIGEALTARKDAVSVTAASDALRQAREFMSEASGPPESDEEQERLTRTLHALDHASRLAEVVGEKGELPLGPSGSDDVRAAGWCAEAMRHAVVIAGDVGALPTEPDRTAPVDVLERENAVAAHGASIEQAMGQLERCANTLRELQGGHRKVTLSSVASGAMSAD